MANRTVSFRTNQGTFEAELFDDLAPKTAGNFATLVAKGYYDGVIFHRVIEGFMIQGGHPSGSGRGGPGYTIPDEFGKGLVHGTPGLLSMANAGPNTGGSQFFITLAATPWLDRKHAIFGKIVDDLQHLGDEFGIERGCRLVEQHDVGLHRQRPRDRRPLFLAARKMGREIVVLVVKTDLVEQAAGTFDRLAPRQLQHMDRRLDDVLKHRQVGP